MITEDRDRPADGYLAGGEHRFPVRVYYEDTDFSGVAYHASYLRWMERARSDLLRLAGVDQRAHAEAGRGGYAVADLAIRYLKPARFDDALVVISWLTKVRQAALVIQQRVMRAGALLTDAVVTAALVAPSGRPCRQPPEWRAAFDRLLVQESPTAA